VSKPDSVGPSISLRVDGNLSRNDVYVNPSPIISGMPLFWTSGKHPYWKSDFQTVHFRVAAGRIASSFALMSYRGLSEAPFGAKESVSLQAIAFTVGLNRHCCSRTSSIRSPCLFPFGKMPLALSLRCTQATPSIVEGYASELAPRPLLVPHRSFMRRWACCLDFPERNISQSESVRPSRPSS
jgi:hypothetical protein